MSINLRWLKRPRNQAVVLPFPEKNFWFYQIFFLTNNQNKDVEVLETEKMNFSEIVKRLKMGESVFITYKNSETYQQDFNTRN
jgi:hypothetical protein